MTPIDRADRDRLADAIREFLDGDLTAFAFDEAISEVSGSTQDRTVAHVASALWFHYDDLKDHTVALSRPEWNYFQRLLLLLASDRHVEFQRRQPRWSATQLVALAAVIGFGACLWQFGFGQHLLAMAMPFGLVSIAIAAWRRRVDSAADTRELTVAPFLSFSELRDTYTSVGHHRKRKYPSDLDGRQIRSLFMNGLMHIPALAMWMMLSPIVLLFQTLPQRESVTRVVPSG